MPETKANRSNGRDTFQTLDVAEKRPYDAAHYRRLFRWELVRRTLFSLPVPRGGRWRRWLLRRFGADIQGGALRSTVNIRHPWLFSLGRSSMVGDRVTVYNLASIRIGAHTLVSQDVYLCGGTHDHAKPHLPLIRNAAAAITIGDGCWICAGAFIGPGVTIGDNSIVGARSVVVKDVPPGVIVAGNPAKVVKKRVFPDESRSDEAGA